MSSRKRSAARSNTASASGWARSAPARRLVDDQPIEEVLPP